MHAVVNPTAIFGIEVHGGTFSALHARCTAQFMSGSWHPPQRRKVAIVGAVRGLAREGVDGHKGRLGHGRPPSGGVELKRRHLVRDVHSVKRP